MEKNIHQRWLPEPTSDDEQTIEQVTKVLIYAQNTMRKADVMLSA